MIKMIPEGIKSQLSLIKIGELARMVRRREDGKKEIFCKVLRTETSITHRILINEIWSQEIDGLPSKKILEECSHVDFYKVK